jgi:hypothetical protein
MRDQPTLQDTRRHPKKACQWHGSWEVFPWWYQFGGPEVEWVSQSSKLNHSELRELFPGIAGLGRWLTNVSGRLKETAPRESRIALLSLHLLSQCCSAHGARFYFKAPAWRGRPVSIDDRNITAGVGCALVGDVSTTLGEAVTERESN